MPTGFRRGVYDVGWLGRMKIITLDPYRRRRRPPLGVACNDVARRRGNMMLRKKFDHPVTIGITDRVRRIHDDRARVLSFGEALKHRPALTHREYVCAAAVKRRVGLDEL